MFFSSSKIFLGSLISLSESEGFLSFLIQDLTLFLFPKYKKYVEAFSPSSYRRAFERNIYTHLQFGHKFSPVLALHFYILVSSIERSFIERNFLTFDSKLVPFSLRSFASTADLFRATSHILNFKYSQLILGSSNSETFSLILFFISLKKFLFSRRELLHFQHAAPRLCFVED